MKTYVIQKRRASADWSKIPSLSIDLQPWEPKVNIEACAQVYYDENALYVRLAAKEKDIRAEYFGPLDFPHRDSCLEFFLSPSEEDPRYLNFEFNPNCCLFLGIGTGRENLMRLAPDVQKLFSPCASRTSDSWNIQYRIPFSFICLFFPEFCPASCKKMRANFYKCGDLTAQEHYLTWNEVVSEHPDFHRPECFGELVFE